MQNKAEKTIGDMEGKGREGRGEARRGRENGLFRFAIQMSASVTFLEQCRLSLTQTSDKRHLNLGNKVSRNLFQHSTRAATAPMTHRVAKAPRNPRQVLKGQSPTTVPSMSCLIICSEQAHFVGDKLWGRKKERG